MTSSDRTSLGLVIAAILCCAAPVLVATGLATAALGAVRQHWGWFVAGFVLVTLAVVLRGRRSRAA